MHILTMEENPPQEQREIEVPEGRNAVDLATEGHTYVAVLREGSELQRSEAPAKTVRFVLHPGKYVVVTDGKIRSLETLSVELLPPPEWFRKIEEVFSLELLSDAPDQHKADGVGELKADGKAACTITVRKLNAEGSVMATEKDHDEIFLRTTGGTLRSAKSAARVRSVRLNKGEAKFRLVSEEQPRFVTVTAFAAPPVNATASLPIEFI